MDGWDVAGPTIHDPLLGWTNAPSTDWPDYYGPGEHFSSNARGFRAVEEYADGVPDGRVRILCLGDSFTDGLGVGDSSTFPAQLEQLLPRTQVVNMAKISYGIDQAVLRYERDARGMDADLVLLAVIDDDLNRARWDHFNGYWPKPRLRVTQGEGMELTSVPVPDFSAAVSGPTTFFQRSALFLLARQVWSETVYEQSDADLVHGILDRLVRLANERGHRVALAYLPTLPEALSGELLSLAGLLERYAEEKSVSWVNTAKAFEGLEDKVVRAKFLQVNQHYSAAGNRRIAEILAEELPLDMLAP